MEDTELYRLICNPSRANYARALSLLDELELTEVRRRSTDQQNSYLHLVVLNLKALAGRCGGDVRPAVPLLYKLALRGCDVNAQNRVGNTALHTACFRPLGDRLVQHLIRLGIDPGITNEMNSRVIHDNAQHKAWLVRGQKGAKCSLWSAVAREDKELMIRYLTSWVRTECRRRRKTLMDLAFETGNYEIVELLKKYTSTNELVCAALACDVKRVKQMLALKSDKPNLRTKDTSQKVPKPLLAEVKTLSGIAEADKVYQLLKAAGAIGEEEYFEQLESSKNAFRSAKFVALVEEMSADSLEDAWQQLHNHRVDLDCTDPETGGTYLHFLVQHYLATEELQLKRLLIRLMYKTALEGVDVHARNNKGETVLLAAYSQPPDRILLDHLICLGVDASVRSNSGHVIMQNTYATRGDLVRQRRHTRRLLPGLHVAVEDGDLERVRHWLGCLCRVNVSKNGRSLAELARDIGDEAIQQHLEDSLHGCEFAAASIAGDLDRMKHHIAMGAGEKKVNACYRYYFAGFTDDWRAEFVPRPLIASVMEYGSAKIASFLLQFGARLDVQYEECAPCGPVAFWAFRDDIASDVTEAIAAHVDVRLRDELGRTILHAAVMKDDNPAAKCRVVEQLLSRGANVAARDMRGWTPRDYCTKGGVVGGSRLGQIIDDFVLNLSYVGDIDAIEQLIIDGYNHINDIRGTSRNKTAKELATLRYYKELLELLDEEPKYHEEIELIHTAVINDDRKGFVKFANEKRVPLGVDRRGRNLLHMAVLMENHDMVAAICEQFPQMIYKGDNLLRTPVHYAVCIRDQRATLSVISTSNSVDMSAKDANNLSVLEYIDQLDRPTPTKLKTRGRRTHDYRVGDLLETERNETPQYLARLAAEAEARAEAEEASADRLGAEAVDPGSPRQLREAIDSAA
ncbi:hypothetical protein BOX15_Mlig009269g2 [Macrostomum lignano]|uniref:ANK_REP_REGION domain-containing protein n=1 Tax=Macrostomum lignano TaxID=282301 RepID=A0A267EKC0_9PLAT|nr:hypothetical protein BOX15_Mlig009269g3 [Macrostomum lignano]PAA61938.1 hypothetical protein BOX15_Mlig009269g2 [Macrostomum lignano]